MTSRFAPAVQSFVCLNGPKQGEYVDAPEGATIEKGSAVAVPWFDAKGIMRYCVYVLVEHEGSLGLMFMKTHDKPLPAQEQVQHIRIVMEMARESARNN